MGPPLPLPKVKYLPFLDKRGHILGFDESFSNLRRARAACSYVCEKNAPY